MKHFEVAERLTGAVLEYSGLFETGNVPGADTPMFGPLQNKSGHGIDWIGKARTGDYYGKFVPIEVKSRLRGLAPSLSTEQAKGADYFASSRVDRAIEARGQWNENRVAPGTVDFAEEIKFTMLRQTYQGFVISHNYLGVPNYAGDRVTLNKW